MTGLADEQGIAPSYLDGWKRLFLGKPMITDDLQHEKLSNGVALGALSPDAISSTAYGPEQIMVGCCRLLGWPRLCCCFR